ncbi:hypothetical protein CR156_19085 [Stenotrophomonas lactitubi]|nr:hypothetical protein CR156_19085 [Stenotrophomonas lactitubi]
MSRVPTIVLFLCLACPPSSGVASARDGLAALPAAVRATILAAQKQPECVRVVEAYVRRTRAWNKTTYLVATSPPVSGGRGFAVLHQDDLADPLSTQERKSFHLELDQSCSKVIEEFWFQ